MIDRHVSQFTVTISTPSKAFSSYDLKTVCQLYELGNGSDVSLRVFPELKCGHISGKAYERELTKLMTSWEERMPIMPFDGTNEATKSIYVYFILHAAISIFGTSAFTICPEKSIVGARGHGLVDYAIDSTRTQRTVGVTEVKNKDIKEGVAQNAVQLESCLTIRKRKACEMEDETFVSKAFGIVSDAEKFYFLECRLNGDEKASFKLSKPVAVNYQPSFMKDTAAVVLSHIGWLLGEVEKPEPSTTKEKHQRKKQKNTESLEFFNDL